MASPAAPALVVDALVKAQIAFETIVRLQKFAADGDQAEALRGLALLAGAIEPELPVLMSVFTAQVEAAEAHHLAKNPAIRVIASIGIAHPHPDAANAHASPPSQPGPSVA